MSTVDNLSIMSHIRAMLLRTDAHASPLLVDEFLRSEEYAALGRQFDQQLLAGLREFEESNANGIGSAQLAPDSADQVSGDMASPAEEMAEVVAELALNTAADVATAAAENDQVAQETKAQLSVAAQASGADANLSTTPARAVKTVELAQSPSSSPSPSEASIANSLANSAAKSTLTSGPATQPAANPARPAAIAPLPAFQLPIARVGSSYRFQLTSSVCQLHWLEITLDAESGLQVDLATGTIHGTPKTAAQYQIKLRFQRLPATDQAPHAQTSAELAVDELSSVSSAPASPSPVSPFPLANLAIEEAAVPLLINPDPRSLWKDLPSDQTASFWRPDTDTVFLHHQEQYLIAASKRGRSHAHVGGFRDDDMCFSQQTDGWTIAVMSDGAGSARYGRRGAQLICQTAHARLQEDLNTAVSLRENILLAAQSSVGQGADSSAAQQLQALAVQMITPAVQAAYAAIEADISRLSVSEEALSWRDFASTALLLLSLKTDFGTLSLSYWVGDGALAVLCPDAVTILGEPDGGEFSGQTRFLDDVAVTQEQIASRVRAHVWPAVEAIFMMSDGVSDPYFETQAALMKFENWQNFWHKLQQEGLQLTADQGPRKSIPPEAAQHLLDWLDFWATGNHDDRSIAILC